MRLWEGRDGSQLGAPRGRRLPTRSFRHYLLGFGETSGQTAAENPENSRVLLFSRIVRCGQLWIASSSLAPQRGACPGSCVSLARLKGGRARKPRRWSLGLCLLWRRRHLLCVGRWGVARAPSVALLAVLPLPLRCGAPCR